MDDLPRTEIVENVAYIPETPGASEPDVWGIFRRDRRLVESTAFFRGPGPHLPYQRPTTDIDLRDIAREAPDECYIYGGRIIPHFGHFLVGGLPRFWRHKELAALKWKILIHSPHDIATLFSHPHVRDIFAAAGLLEADFVRFTEPTRIGRLIVPWPSFEEGHLAYGVFAQFCHEIGRNLIADEPMLRSSRPVFFTKEKMTGGISRFVNEERLTSVIRDHGFDVVASETMTVADQVRLFSSRDLITGSFGSVFHASIFTPRRRMLMLNWGDTVFGNFTLLDAINRNETHYVYPGTDVTYCGPIEHFGANWTLTNPEATARQFLVAAQAFAGRSCQPEHRLLSFNKPTRQSSYETQEGNVHWSGADGRMTAGATFTTGFEAQPWWQVDLERSATITQVVIYNVVGPPIVTNRAAQFRLLVSQDGNEWVEVFRRTEPEPFGGIDGNPFVWTPSTSMVTRFVRVQLLGSDFLHLDQVQIFGQ